MKHALLFFFFLCCSVCIAQNLVPNPSFEDTLWCPKQGIPYNGVADWYAVSKTPDYFHACFSPQPFSVPDNMFDYQYAATGFAYSGFCLYSTIDTTYREAIGVELLSSLSIGIEYFISFKVNATSHSRNGANNKIGVLFSTVKYSDAINNLSPPTNDFCHVWTDSIITDTINWVQVFGSFIADSAYTFLTIGNFFLNSHTDTMRLRPVSIGQNPWLESYYFIDDICVSEDSTLCVDNLTAIKTLQSRKRELTIYPNPVNNYLAIVTEAKTDGFIELYDIEGNIFLKHKIPRGHYEFYENVSQISNGIYFLKLVTNNKVISQKIIIHH